MATNSNDRLGEESLVVITVESTYVSCSKSLVLLSYMGIIRYGRL